MSTVSDWIRGLESGSESAANSLWQRYITELETLARNRLGRHPTSAVDEEDIAVSVFTCLCECVRRGRVQLADRTSLWALLVKITGDKVSDRIRFDTAQKRMVYRDERLQSTSRNSRHEFVAVDASAEFLTALKDEVEDLISNLPDETYVQIVQMRLAGWTNEEIARQLDCTIRRVQRKLKNIFDDWQKRLLD